MPTTIDSAGITFNDASTITSAYPWKNISSNYTAANNERIAANTSGGTFTINLPASPSFGHNVSIIDYANTWSTNNLTVARNGSTIEGLSEDLVCDATSLTKITILYNGSTWRVYA